MEWIILEKLILICKILIYIVALKGLSIGSEFSFYYWFKYRKIYTNWYKRRETFEEYLILKQYKEIK